MAEAQIEVDVDLDTVFTQFSDLELMAQWSGANDVEVLQWHPDGRPARARWSENYGLIPDEFILDYEWADRSVKWRLVEGRILQHEVGHVVLEDVSGSAGDRTRVTYSLELGLAIPMPHQVTEQIAGSSVKDSLKGLKKHLASLSGD